MFALGVLEYVFMQKGKSGIRKACLFNLDTRGKTGQKCVGRWKKVEERVILRCVREMSKRV